jgi:hypothetical protein
MTTGMRIVNGKSIKEIHALFADVTIASGKGAIMKFRLSSSGFKLGDVEFVGNFIPGVLATATSSSVNRLKILKDLDVPITDPIDIDVYHNQIVALGAAGYFNTCLIYT